MSTVKKLFILAVIFIVPVLTVAAGGGQELTILYTNSLNGNLLGCDCKDVSRAGLVNRAAYLNDMKNRKNMLLLDGGDIFDAREDRLLSDFILDVYGRLGYDFAGIGDQEFSNGAEYLLEKIGFFPFISHNLEIVDRSGADRPVTAGPAITRKNGNKIGVISVIDPDVFRFYGEEVTGRVKVSDPAAALRKQLDLLRDEGVDLIVLLFHGSWDAAEELVSSVPGIDVAVVTHEQLLKEPEKINGTLLAAPGEQGNRLGILTLTVEKGDVAEYDNRFILFKYMITGGAPYAESLVQEYLKQLTARIKTK